MGQSAVMGATMQCTFGAAPATLNPLPTPKVTIEGRPAATVMDMTPTVNIPPFGMCSSLSNPTVASATSAALGVLTPMPCLPAIVGPWKPGATTVTLGGKPALVSGSTCNCAYGGVISMIVPGAMRTTAS
jgi:uncharacterized Zn-binding protein involved in type VI secretion